MNTTLTPSAITTGTGTPEWEGATVQIFSYDL